MKQRTVGPRLFTVEEAEAQLPFVQERLAAFRGHYARYEAVRNDLSVLRLVACSGGDAKNPDRDALDRLEREQGRLLKSLKTVQDDLLDSGCVPKSFQEGLVDFFALKEGRLVFLCWKQGEEGIRAWHTMEGGFANRRPIKTFCTGDEGDESENA
jgi:hypothetical protein